jgi:FkbM family methyltransferase
LQHVVNESEIYWVSTDGCSIDDSEGELDPKLIYDVGMHNGDDTAYYLLRGFRVVAIEPNPELVATAANRFRREIEAGYPKILNVGIAADEGELPFWVCQTDSRLSSFDRRNDHWTASTPSMKFAFLAENSARFLMTLAYLST